MTNEHGTTNKPPYLPYSTFKNFLASLKAGAIPSRIDKSLLDRYSGSIQSWLLSALKFFRLIDEGGKPQPTLEYFIGSGEEERKKAWRDIFEKAYAPLIEGLDLGRATPGELSERFAAQGLSGETLSKCHSFFAAAAEDAGVPLADHLKVRAKPTGPRKSRKNRNGGTAEETVTPDSDTGGAAQKAMTMREMLLSKFPEFDPTWSEPIQTAWFAGFAKLMKASGEDEK
jgi:Family of unknown function (DUF5343)